MGNQRHNHPLRAGLDQTQIDKLEIFKKEHFKEDLEMNSENLITNDLDIEKQSITTRLHEVVARQYVNSNESINSLNVTIISLGGCGINIGNTILDLSPLNLQREESYNGFLITSNSKEKDGDRNFSSEQVLWLLGEDGQKMEGASRNLDKCKKVFPSVVEKNPQTFNDIEKRNFNSFMKLLQTHVTHETDVVLVVAGTGGGTGAALLKNVIDITNLYISSMLKAKNKIALGAATVLPVHTFGEVKNTYVVSRELLTESYAQGRIDFIMPIDNEALEIQYNYILEEDRLDKQNTAVFEGLTHEQFVNQLFANWLHEIIIASALDSSKIDRGDIHRVLKQSDAGIVIIEKNVLKEEDLEEDEEYNLLTEIKKSIENPTFSQGYDIDSIKNIAVIVVQAKGGSPITDYKEMTLDSDLKKEFKNADFVKVGLLQSRYVNQSEVVYYIVAKFSDYPSRIKNLEKEYLKLKVEKEEKEKKENPINIFSSIFNVEEEVATTIESTEESSLNVFGNWSFDAVDNEEKEKEEFGLGRRRRRKK